MWRTLGQAVPAMLRDDTVLVRGDNQDFAVATVGRDVSVAGGIAFRIECDTEMSQAVADRTMDRGGMLPETAGGGGKCSHCL